MENNYFSLRFDCFGIRSWWWQRPLCKKPMQLKKSHLVSFFFVDLKQQVLLHWPLHWIHKAEVCEEAKQNVKYTFFMNKKIKRPKITYTYWKTEVQISAFHSPLRWKRLMKEKLTWYHSCCLLLSSFDVQSCDTSNF